MNGKYANLVYVDDNYKTVIHVSLIGPGIGNYTVNTTLEAISLFLVPS